MTGLRRVFGVVLWIVCLGVFMTPRGLHGLSDEALPIFLTTAAIGWLSVAYYFLQQLALRFFLSCATAGAIVFVGYLVSDAYFEAFLSYSSLTTTALLLGPIAAGILLVFSED